jgi:hypothetical protein
MRPAPPEEQALFPLRRNPKRVVCRLIGSMRMAAMDLEEERAVREKAREAIRDGRLPDRVPDATWGGPATGVACAICGTAQTPGALELELEFARDGDLGRRDKFQVHVACFKAWELERASNRQDGAPSPGLPVGTASPTIPVGDGTKLRRVSR